MDNMEQDALEEASRELAEQQQKAAAEQVRQAEQTATANSGSSGATQPVDYDQMARDILSKQPVAYNVPEPKKPKALIGFAVVLVVAAIGLWVWLTFFR